MQVIPEEGAPAGNDFSFPGAEDNNPQEGYGPTAPMSAGPTGATSPRSIGGTNPLSTATGPSQSLTGILAGANELLGEMGTTQTTVLTGTLTGAPGSQRSAGLWTGERPHSFREDKGAGALVDAARTCMPCMHCALHRPDAADTRACGRWWTPALLSHVCMGLHSLLSTPLRIPRWRCTAGDKSGPHY